MGDRGTLRYLVWSELRRLLRDPLALLLLFGTPALTYPVLSRGMALTQANEARRTADATLVVAADPALMDTLDVDANALGLEVVPLNHPNAGTVAVDLILEGDATGPSAVRVRGDRWRSSTALQRLQPALDAWRSTEHAARWDSAGITRSPSTVLPVSAVDHASLGKREDVAAGRILAPMLVFLLLTGGLYVALDLFAGERERGTLETVLVTRIKRTTLLASKAITVFLVSTALGTTTLLSLVACHWFHVVDTATFGLPPSAGALAWTLLLLPPLSATLTGVLVCIAAWAPDHRTGQAVGLPLLLLGTTPAVVATLPGIQSGPLLAMVPVTGISLALRDALAGELTVAMGVFTLAAATAHAAGGLWIARRFVQQEGILHGGTTFGRDPDDLRPAAAFTFLAALTSVWFFGQLAQARHAVGGLVFTLLVPVLGPAFVAPIVIGRPLPKALAAHVPRLRDVLMGVVVGVCAPGLGDLVSRIQVVLIPRASTRTEALGGALDLELSIWATVAGLAVLPAICEELLFRGTLLQLLRSRMGTWSAAGVSALMFGMFHLDLQRLLPTAALGFVFALLAIRSRSIVPGIVAHALNNGLLVGLVAAGLIDPTQDAPLAAVLAAVSVLVVAVWATGQGSSPTKPVVALSSGAQVH